MLAPPLTIPVQAAQTIMTLVVTTHEHYASCFGLINGSGCAGAGAHHVGGWVSVATKLQKTGSHATRQMHQSTRLQHDGGQVALTTTASKQGDATKPMSRYLANNNVKDAETHGACNIDV